MTTWKIEYEIREGQHVTERGWQKIKAATQQKAYKKAMFELWQKNGGINTITSVLSVEEVVDA